MKNSLLGVLSLVLAMPFLVSASEGDLPGIGRYPNAELDNQVSREARNYPIMAGQVKKVRGEIRANKELWLNGWLERRIYEIPTGHSSQDAFDLFSKEIKALGAEVTFTCEGRSCGSSNVWANDIFNVATLYGHDREQHYLLASHKVNGKQGYYLLYTVTRGTHRVYAMIDHFIVSPFTP